MKFSKSTGCFYPEGIDYPSLPSDLIDVEQDDYDSAMARPLGATLDVIDGQLVIVPAPSLTPAESLAAAKSAKSTELSTACAAAITNGFTSTALGASHTYPSDQSDQANLSANVLSSLLPNLPGDWVTLQLCCDADGVWSYRQHTVAQIQQVGTDGKAAVLAKLTHHAALREAVQAVESLDEVALISW
jgi:hypothetical protein